MCLIADNRDDFSPENIIMVDDGTGLSVAIPTILISKSDGEKIKQAIKEQESINSQTGSTKDYVVLLIDFELVLRVDVYIIGQT